MQYSLARNFLTFNATITSKHKLTSLVHTVYHTDFD